MERSVSFYITSCVGVALVLVGVVGNAVAGAVVVRSKDLWKYTTSLYVLVLAVVDSAVLLYQALLLPLFSQHNLLYPTILGDCGPQTFVEFFLPDFEAWILVNMALERACAVYFPFKLSTWFTKPKAALALVATAVLVSVHNLVFALQGPVTIPSGGVNVCSHNIEHYHLRITCTLFIGTVIPFVLLGASGIAIVTKIIQNKQKKMTGGMTNYIKVSRMTVMLMAVAIGFLVCTAPYKTQEFLSNYLIVDEAVWEQTKPFLTTLWLMNFVINVYIYSICNSKFRKELYNGMRELRGKLKC